MSCLAGSIRAIGGEGQYGTADLTTAENRESTSSLSSKSHENCASHRRLNSYIKVPFIAHFSFKPLIEEYTHIHATTKPSPNPTSQTRTMTVDNLRELNAHEQPSDELRAIWKSYSKANQEDLLSGPDIDDLTTEAGKAEFVQSGSISGADMRQAFEELRPGAMAQRFRDCPIYYHPILPGLLIVPNLLPPAVQKSLLSRLIHRDLSNPQHQTNLHLHYNLPYPPMPQSSDTTTPTTTAATTTATPTTTTTTTTPPPSLSPSNPTIPPPPHPQSFFTLPPTSPTPFSPLDPSIHKPLTITQVLTRRIHWLTLGHQYDWTARIYPSTPPPPFPADIQAFLERLFPQTRAQAAICNFYSPGDTMMMHRDVSEEVNKGLVSLSLGCDALFMVVGNEEGGNGARRVGPCGGGKPKGAGENGAEGGGGEGGKVEPSVPKYEQEGFESLDEKHNPKAEGEAVEASPNHDDAEGENKTQTKNYILLRIRSGDAIYMTEEARYAWHGVPKVLKGTCPPFLKDWPAGESHGMYEEWKGWMENKRINLNVRQMTDCPEEG